MVKKNLFYYSPSHIFQKKKFLLFGRIFLFFFLFSSIQEKHICEQTPVLLVFFALYLSLWKNSSVFLKWISRNFCVFPYSNFSQPFFVTSCFCSSRFAFTSFFISFPVWPSIFLISLLLELGFFEQQFHFWKKKTLQFIFFYTHAFPLYVLLLMHLFICCLFFSLRFFSFLIHLFPFSFFCFLCQKPLWKTSWKKELLQIWTKHVCLFTFLLGTFFIFICLCTKLCEEPDCIFNESCVALLFSFTFFFCNIFSNKISFTKWNWECNFFFLCNSLIVHSWSLLFVFSFLLIFFNNKTNFDTPLFD